MLTNGDVWVWPPTLVVSNPAFNSDDNVFKSQENKRKFNIMGSNCCLNYVYLAC